MQKFFLAIALIGATLISQAQTPVDAQKQLDAKKLDKAKEIVDKLTSDPNQKSAYAWLVKAQVYNALATDDKFKAAVPDAYEQAFEAYKKAYELDPNDNSIKLDFYKAPFVSYEGVANKAAQAYQANNMAAAFDAYKKTIEYGTWLNQKHLSFNNFSVANVDTSMVFMAGFTAMKQDKADDAATYFARLADARIGKEADYVIPYQFLASYYKKKKDEANFKKYVDLGRQIYPNDPYFTTIKIDYARENNNYPELFKAYEELIAMQPDSLNNSLSYASELFDYLYIKNADKRPADYDEVAAKIESNIKKTLAKDYDPLSSNLIIAQLYYNQGLDQATESDKIKSTKPEDIKRKNDLKAKALAKYELALPYTEKVASILEAKGVATLGAREKHTLKNMYIMLGDMYTAKGDKVKAADYDKKYTALK
jgi:tetratricopeptide (TPR) repeat protein